MFQKYNDEPITSKHTYKNTIVYLMMTKYKCHCNIQGHGSIQQVRRMFSFFRNGMDNWKSPTRIYFHDIIFPRPTSTSLCYFRKSFFCNIWMFGNAKIIFFSWHCPICLLFSIFMVIGRINRHRKCFKLSRLHVCFLLLGSVL